MKIDRVWIEQQYERAYRVDSAEEFIRLYRSRAEGWPVVFDTETTGLTRGVPNVLFDPVAECEISQQLYPVVFGISIAFVVEGGAFEKFPKVLDRQPEWNGFVLLWGRRGSEEFEAARCVLADDCDLVAHNAKFDSAVCEMNDIDLGGRLHCTVVQSRVWWNRFRSVGLKSATEFLCPKLSQWDDPLKRELKRLKSAWTRRINAGEVDWPYRKVDYANYSFIDSEMMAKYATLDVFMTMCLFLRLQGEARWYD